MCIFSKFPLNLKCTAKMTLLQFDLKGAFVSKSQLLAKIKKHPLWVLFARQEYSSNLFREEQAPPLPRTVEDAGPYKYAAKLFNVDNRVGVQMRRERVGFPETSEYEFWGSEQAPPLETKRKSPVESLFLRQTQTAIPIQRGCGFIIL